MKKLKIFILVLFCLIPLCLSACSYKEFEDSLKKKLTKKEEENYINPANIPEEPTTYENQESTENETQKVYAVGDTVTYSAPTNSDSNGKEIILYTLNDFHFTNNINELNLNSEDFNDTSLIDSSGNIDEDYRLITIDVTVENESYPGFDEDADATMLFIEMNVGFKEGIEDPDGPWLFFADYFKDHLPLDKNDGSDFYKFILPIGDSIDTSIGWIIPKNQFNKESLYYIIGSEGSSEDYQYFELELNLEEK